MKVLDWLKDFLNEPTDERIKAEVEREIKKIYPKTCEMDNCNVQLSILSYRCPYCNKYHCDEHRLPEHHNCKNPKNPYHPQFNF